MIDYANQLDELTIDQLLIKLVNDFDIIFSSDVTFIS